METLFNIALILLCVALIALIISLIINENRKSGRNDSNDITNDTQTKDNYLKTPIENQKTASQTIKTPQNNNEVWNTWKDILPPEEEHYYSEQYKKQIKEPIYHSGMPYKAATLLTDCEYEFYRYLRVVCKAYDIIICPKVRMEDFIEVTTKIYSEKQRYRGYIKSSHVDFLLCDDDFKIMCAIELDDRSHWSKKAQEKDERKDEIYRTVSIPLFRVKTWQAWKPQIKEVMLYCIPFVQEKREKEAQKNCHKSQENSTIVERSQSQMP